MANRHRTPTITARLDAELMEAFLQKCDDENLNKNAMIKKMIAAYCYNQK